MRRETYLVGDKSVWLMAYSWWQRRPLPIPDHTLLAIRHMRCSSDERRTTFHEIRFTRVSHAAGELVLQFGLDRVEEGLHLKGLLKRAVGAQHFGDVEKVENTNHVTAAGDRDDFHVREFS